MPRARGLGQDLVEITTRQFSFRIKTPSPSCDGVFVLCHRELAELPQAGALLSCLCLARVGDDLIELRHGQHAGHAEFADDEGRRAAETERLGLIVVAREDGVDRLGVGREVALERGRYRCRRRPAIR